VDADGFHPRRRDDVLRRSIAGDGPLILHVGRLALEKGVETLVNAFTIAHQFLGDRATFCIAGDGPLAGSLRERLPFARYLGFLPRAELARLYASADLFVFPSATETCGLVALEAMASGLPVIAARAGDHAAHRGFRRARGDVRGGAGLRGGEGLACRARSRGGHLCGPERTTGRRARGLMLPVRFHEWEQRWLLEFARVSPPPWLDRSLHLVTHAGGVVWTLLFPAVLLVPQGSRPFAMLLLLANISSHLAVQLLKRTIARPRPSAVIPRFCPAIRLPDQFSFPSGHACAATAIAVPFVLAAHPAGMPLLIVAALVGVSRVYLGVHYPSDVIAGHLLGALGALAATLIVA
jgi:undecaprenyl-diphosphatase